MAKRRTAHSRCTLPDPADVLCGRVTVDLKTLLTLIHAVNPTGEGCRGAEQARRYAMKGRLQSLLIRHHAPQLEFRAEPDDPGLVAIRDSSFGRDGCHALLAELEDDARSIMQSRLDLQVNEATETSPSGPRVARAGRGVRPKPLGRTAATGSADELLARGRTALEEYDYDTARQSFERAMKVSQSGDAPIELLSLLVRTIGADEEALELADSLPPVTMSDARVKLLVAEVAARAGDAQRVLKLLRGIECEAATSTLIVCARTATRNGEVDQARQLLQKAESADALHPELPLARQELAATQAQRQLSAERQLQSALDAGHPENAGRLARQILSSWPGSLLARQTVRRIEDQRQVNECQRALALADDVEAKGDFEAALALTTEARSAPVSASERARLEAQVARLQGICQQRRAEREIAEVCELLPGRAGLFAYLRLAERLRLQVRAARDAPELDWLDAMTATKKGGAGVLVEAAMALREAIAVEKEQPQRALDLVASHEVVLGILSAARDLVARARSVIGERGKAAELERQRRAQGALESANRETEAGRHSEALAIIETVDLAVLPETSRQVAVTLRAELTACREVAGAEQNVATLRAAGRPLRARRALDQLIERRGRRPGWTDLRAEITSQLRRDFRVESHPGDFAPGWQRRLVLDPLRPSCCIDEERGELVLVQVAHREMFVGQLDLGNGEVKKLTTLRTPAPMRDATWRVERGVIQVVAAGASVLEVSLEGFDVLRWRPATTHDGVAGATPVVAPGFSCLWHVDCDSKVNVFDLRAGEVVRKLRFSYATPLFGVDSAQMVRLNTSLTRATLATARGKSVPGMPLPPSTYAVAVHPSDSAGLVVVHKTSVVTGGTHWSVVALSADGTRSAPDTIEDAATWPTPSLMTSLARQRTVVKYSASDGSARICVYRPTANGLERVQEAALAPDVALVFDSDARHTYWLANTGDSLAIGQFVTTPPTVAGPHSDALRVAGELIWPAPSCRGTPHDAPQRAQEFQALADDARLAGSPALVRRLLNTPANQRRGLAAAFAAPEQWGALGPGRAEMLPGKAPTDPTARLYLADRAVRGHRWAVALEQTAAADIGRLEEHQRQHLHHLTALSHLKLGEIEKAQQAIEQARRCHGRCDLDGLIELLGHTYNVTAPQPSGRLGAAILGPIERADGALAAGDYRGVLDSLDRPAIWQLGEVQTLGRIARAYLELEVGEAADALLKRHALGTFCAAMEREGHLRRELPIAVNRWEEEVLDAVAARAAQWLDDHGRPR